jgi:hypothetical protein
MTSTRLQMAFVALAIVVGPVTGRAAGAGAEDPAHAEADGTFTIHLEDDNAPAGAPSGDLARRGAKAPPSAAKPAAQKKASHEKNAGKTGSHASDPPAKAARKTAGHGTDHADAHDAHAKPARRPRQARRCPRRARRRARCPRRARRRARCPRQARRRARCPRQARRSPRRRRRRRLRCRRGDTRIARPRSETQEEASPAGLEAPVRHRVSGGTTQQVGRRRGGPAGHCRACTDGLSRRRDPVSRQGPLYAGLDSIRRGC